jgi:hypothetical protein
MYLNHIMTGTVGLAALAVVLAPSDASGGEAPSNKRGNYESIEPTQELTIQKLQFRIPMPYVAGPIELTEGEAAALNQTYAENIRNNFATQMKTAAEATPPKALTQTDLDTYVASYAFGKRSGGVRSRDPIAAEERRLAKDAITSRIIAVGKKVKDYSPEQLAEMVAKVVETGKFRAQAEAVVAARSSTVDPLADLVIEDAKPKAPTAAAAA